tara:strand:- start:351 stop:470 length:120 start_codon:yes stop_codon:yes gene_type:complete
MAGAAERTAAGDTTAETGATKASVLPQQKIDWVSGGVRA